MPKRVIKQQVYPLGHSLACWLCTKGDNPLDGQCANCITGKSKFKMLNEKQLNEMGCFKEDGRVIHFIELEEVVGEKED